MSWLPWPVLPKKRWPEIRFQEKRAITLDEHRAIVARETNPERKAFYLLTWHLGASQSDIALLEADNIDWSQRTVSFRCKKTGTGVHLRFDDEAADILRSLPATGPLFPYLRTVRPGDRATEFKQRCIGLGIKGVTLHSYRYAWAERARMAGYPERFAMENLGHNSKAVHRAYAKKAKVLVPSLTEYARNIVPLTPTEASAAAQSTGEGRRNSPMPKRRKSHETQSRCCSRTGFRLGDQLAAEHADQTESSTLSTVLASIT